MWLLSSVFARAAESFTSPVNKTSPCLFLSPSEKPILMVQPHLKFHLETEVSLGLLLHHFTVAATWSY